MAEKILIVDDDEESLKLIELLLQRQGYDVVLAGTGQKALDCAQSEQPDLVILDIMMSAMDGYEVCRRLRHDPLTQRIPVIMFTAKTLVDDKVAGFEAGADDYLTKPTHPAELVSRVKTALARRAAQQHVTAPRALVWGFLGAKGGVGTTTLAVNVAAAMAKTDAVVLADFRPGQGTLGLSLGIARSNGVASLFSRQPRDITARAVEGELISHTSGLRLLLSSGRPKETLLNIQPELVAAVVRHLRALQRIVVLDLGAGINHITAHVLPDVDHLTLAVEPNRVALALARDLIGEIAQIGLDQARISVVLANRVQTSAQVPWQEAEQILAHEITAIIAPAPELAFQAAEAGQPMVLFQPNSIVASQFNKLAEEIAGRSRV
jgi:pilus assembly protein CpaE